MALMSGKSKLGGIRRMPDIRDLAEIASPIGAKPLAPGSIHFSLNGVPERDRPAMFREFFGQEVIKYDLERLPDVPFEIDVTLKAMPGLMMMSGYAYGSHNKRTRETLAADPTDDIGMAVNLSGPLRIMHGKGDLILEDGEAVLLPANEVCSFMHRPPGGILALRVPRKQFAPLVTRVDDTYFRRIPNRTSALRLLTDYIKVAQDAQRIETPELQHLVAHHVYDLMALAVGATRDASEIAENRGVRAARLRAMKDDIAKNIDQPDLSVGALAHRHRCTPRFVQRLFETEGTTFTEYVLEQRLACAYRMLTDPRHEGDKISVVALDSGFGDVSYFNRAFRRRYRMAPSDVREEVRRDMVLYT
jgi:AraC-like DNA-binding protein